LIIINNGDVYILDCVKMILLEDTQGSVLQGKVTDYAAIDLKEGKLLSVSESGHGRLISVSHNLHEANENAKV
jgi:hypothetical protein